jgi:hypothetical protein
MTWKYKIGDVFKSQGAQLEVVGLVEHEGQPVYEMRTPHTEGEPWLMSEYWLDSMTKCRMKVES